MKAVVFLDYDTIILEQIRFLVSLDNSFLDKIIVIKEHNHETEMEIDDYKNESMLVSTNSNSPLRGCPFKINRTIEYRQGINKLSGILRFPKGKVEIMTLRTENAYRKEQLKECLLDVIRHQSPDFIYGYKCDIPKIKKGIKEITMGEHSIPFTENIPWDTLKLVLPVLCSN